MVFEVRRTEATNGDLESLFDYLIATYMEFGAPPAEAAEKALRRVDEIDRSFDKLGLAPYQGTIWTEISENLRWTTKDRAIIYFAVQEEVRRVTIVAVFYGGQDHTSRMLARIRS